MAIARKKKKKKKSAGPSLESLEKMEKRQKRNTIIGGVIIGIILIAVIVGVVWSVVFYQSPDSATDDSTDETTDDSTYELTGGVAATVNGEEIAEDDITTEIMEMREDYGYDDDDSWAEYLYDSGYTVESLREEYIDTYVDEELLAQAIEENGISISDDDAEEAFQEEYTSYGYDRDTYVSLLESYFGYTEEEYISYLKEDLITEALTEVVAPEEEVADEDVVAYLNENIDTYGETRSLSVITISADDTDDADSVAAAAVTANHVYEAIASGEMTFDEAALAYDDAGEDATEDYTDYGYDCLYYLDTAEEEALYALEEIGDVSEPVDCDGYYEIIMYTGSYSAGDEETDIANIPEDIVDDITTTLVDEQVSDDYDAWFEEYEASAEIVINDIPDGLAYYVDLDAYEESLEEEESTDEDDADSDSDEEEAEVEVVEVEEE